MSDRPDYYQIINQYWGHEIARVVGLGLNRTDKLIMANLQDAAVYYFKDNEARFNKLPLSTQRQMIADFVLTGEKHPEFV